MAQRVNLYVTIQTHGPRRQDGSYIWLLERIRENGEPDPRTMQRSGTREDTIDRNLAMEAIVEALDHVKEGNEVQIILCPDYMARAMPAAWANGWVDTWERNGWKTVRGEEVKNAELWKKCTAALRRKNAVFAEKGAANAYKSWMVSELKTVARGKNAACEEQGNGKIRITRMEKPGS